MLFKIVATFFCNCYWLVCSGKHCKFKKQLPCCVILRLDLSMAFRAPPCWYTQQMQHNTDAVPCRYSGVNGSHGTSTIVTAAPYMQHKPDCQMQPKCLIVLAVIMQFWLCFVETCFVHQLAWWCTYAAVSKLILSYALQAVIDICTKIKMERMNLERKSREVMFNLCSVGVSDTVIIAGCTNRCHPVWGNTFLKTPTTQGYLNS